MSVHVRVPATTANLGPGFDVLGLALGLWNEIRVEPAPRLDIHISGEGEEVLPRDASNLVYRAMRRLAEHVGRLLPRVRLTMLNRIPLQAGLGSSSAAIVGGLAAAAALLDVSLPRADLLRLAVEIEGHPDNVAPALYGGLVAVAMDDHGPIVTPIPVPDTLRVAVVLPNVRVSTEEARRLLPATIPHRDAVFNVARAVLTAQALQRGDFDLLARVMQDRLHEPFRRALIPAFDEVVAAGKAAGAAAVVISGSGPALAAFAAQGHEHIARAMVDTFARAGVHARWWVLNVAGGVEATREP